MLTAIPRIQEFPKDGRTWRVDWFGAVERNENVPTEPTIQVIVSPLKPGTGNPASASSLVHDDRRTIKIGVGQLPAVAIGSLWLDRRCIATGCGTPQTFHDLLIAPSKVCLIATDHKENGEPLIPFKFHRVGGHGLKAKCLAVEWMGDPFGIIIPTTEIIRFYYATSTDLSRATFSGDFRHDLDSIVNVDECKFDEAEQRCRIKLRKEFADPDAWVIARILCSHEAAKGAHLVHDSLMRQRAMDETWPYPEAAFPFSGKTTLQARAKKIESLGKWRYLVFSLERCTATFPFESLVCGRDNDHRQANPDTDLPDEEKLPGYQAVKGDRPSDPTGAEMQSDMEPSNHAEATQVTLPTARFGALDGKKLEKPEKDECRYKNGKLQGLDTITLDQFGTGEGTYGETSAAPIKINSAQVRNKGLPADFDNLIAALTKLDTIPGFTASARPQTPEIAYIPLTSRATKRQWSYLDSSKRIRRQVVVGDILHQGKAYCLVEFQWRPNGESFKLALVSNQSQEAISDRTLEKILWKLAKAEGRWESMAEKEGCLEIKTMKHTWPTIDNFASAIASSVTQKKSR